MTALMVGVARSGFRLPPSDLMAESMGESGHRLVHLGSGNGEGRGEADGVGADGVDDQLMVQQSGAGYHGRPRHAKAGGEEQTPAPDFGYFGQGSQSMGQLGGTVTAV